MSWDDGLPAGVGSLWQDGPGFVRVLEADAGLAAGLEGRDELLAVQRAVAAVCMLREGPWQPGRELPLALDDLGLLVLDGYLMRGVHVGGRESVEVLGPGDLLRPTDYDSDPDAPIRFAANWKVLARSRVAVLDSRFARAIAMWPSITSALLSRTLRRSRDLALLMAIANLPHLDMRLVGVLWHLAYRFGRVTPEGVVLPVRLTHEVLAALVGSRRPSVSTSLKHMIDAGRLRRTSNGGWLLLEGPPAEMALGGVISAAPSTATPR